MLNNKLIHVKHLTSLQTSLIANRSAAEEMLVNKLYQCAKSSFLEEKQSPDSKVVVSRFVAQAEMVAATATDLESGLFIQLSGSPRLGMDGALLVFGRKFCQELQDTMRQQVTTRLWSK